MSRIGLITVRERVLRPQRKRSPRIPSRAQAWGRPFASVTGGLIRPELLDPGLLSIVPSYVDRFTLRTEAQATARDWAKTMFEEILERAGRELVFGTLLGLEIGPDGDAAAVSGWRIEQEDPARIRVTARGRGIRGNLVVEQRPGMVTLTTALACTSPFKAVLWRVLSSVHRREAPGLLTGAAELLADRIRSVPERRREMEMA